MDYKIENKKRKYNDQNDDVLCTEESVLNVTIIDYYNQLINQLSEQLAIINTHLNNIYQKINELDSKILKVEPVKETSEFKNDYFDTYIA